MRVAYLTGTYPRATDTFIQREVFALRQKNIFVQTFAVRRPGDDHMVGPEQAKERDQTVYLLPPNWFHIVWSHIQLFLVSPVRYITTIQLAWQASQPGIRGLIYQLIYFLEAGLLAAKVKHLKIDHLHNHLGDSSCTVAMLAAKLGSFSFSFTLHGPYIFYEPYRWALETKINQAKFVACISYFCRSQAMFFSSFEMWEKLTIVHCGVDPKFFKSAVHHDQNKNLLCVGRLSAAKGFPILLEAVSLIKEDLPEVHLTVIGDGEDRATLEKLSQQLGISQQVSFVGYKSQNEVRDYVSQTDVFVLPSFAEGVPVSLMEAMASGVPVVSTQIAGISELVEDGVSGYLVPPGDVKATAEKVIALLRSAPLRQEFGRAGRAKVEVEFNLAKESEWLYKVMTAYLSDTPITIRPSEALNAQPAVHPEV
jgi:colanic acid/amylovoran biosynthesis glycosyltransferase